MATNALVAGGGGSSRGGEGIDRKHEARAVACGRDKPNQQLRLSQSLLLLYLLGEGLFLLLLLLHLEELGSLALQLFHACLMGSIEGALVFQGLGLHVGLSCLHPVVALLCHVSLLLLHSETLGVQLETLFFQMLLYRRGRSSHAVEDGPSCSRTGSRRSRHSEGSRTET